MVLFKKKLCYAKNAFPKRLFWKHENCSDKDKAEITGNILDKPRQIFC